jgi:predicted DNA-binding transcriptional regulator YafY
MTSSKRKRRRKPAKAPMIPNIIQLLTAAIREKRSVAIRYHDQRHVRVIEPHVIYTHEGGELVVDAYQTRGYSASGRPPPFWRPFRLKKISAVSLLKENFETRYKEGFVRDKDRYSNGLVAVVDDRRHAAAAVPIEAVVQTATRRRSPYTHPQPDQMGPELPKNPFRR